MVGTLGGTVETFGAMVRRRRKALPGFTIAGLARLVGASTPHVTLVELGKRDAGEKLRTRIAAVLASEEDMERRSDEWERSQEAAA